MSLWASIQHQLEKIITADGDPIDPKTVQNARDFLHLAERRCPLPAGIAKGYWPTICIWWDQIEFEIFADKIEVYRFLNGETLIAEFPRRAGEPFPEELVSQLPTVLRSDP